MITTLAIPTWLFWTLCGFACIGALTTLLFVAVFIIFLGASMYEQDGEPRS